MQANKFLLLVFVVLLASSSNATLVEVSVETDKDVYELGEEILIDVTAYNPGTEAETLTFTDSIHASYEIDGVYNWAYGRFSQPVVSTYILNPHSSTTWSFTHTQQNYALGIGSHSVVGEVGALELIGEYSDPVQFTVVPEPLTLALMVLGSVFIRRK